ncbi:MAG: type II secretion system F family protein [Candidatus Woesearchaeota archaeon]
MSFSSSVAKRFPDLERKLRVAHWDIIPEKYMQKVIRSTLLMSITLTFLAFVLVDKTGGNMLIVPVVFLLFLAITFLVMLRQADVKIAKRAKDIDREVLFAGRFLVIKLNSGRPLVNAIVDASNSYGVANKYFKEIVRDIDLGTPLEKSLTNAMYYSPSHKFRRILFQITTALKIGIDVTQNLEATLDEIQDDQLVEIQRYGKRLNAFTMFYMLLAIVIPSLGVTLFIVVSSLVSLNVDTAAFMMFAFFMVLFQLIFLSIFKSIRPNVNI